MKFLNIVGSMKRKLDLLLAFASGAAVGYSAGVGVKVLDKLLDCKKESNGSEESDGISAKKAKKVKESLESTPSTPDSIPAGA